MSNKDLTRVHDVIIGQEHVKPQCHPAVKMAKNKKGKITNGAKSQ